MQYTDIQAYVDSLDNLKKIEITIEEDEEVSGSFYVVKTKETYVYEREVDADTKINVARNEDGFVGCDKKFKPSKVNKAGEIIRPETWTVVVKLNH